MDDDMIASMALNEELNPVVGWVPTKPVVGTAAVEFGEALDILNGTGPVWEGPSEASLAKIAAFFRATKGRDS